MSDQRAARIRDKQCTFADCGALILRQSKLCRYHLGVVHGHASSRTFRCSDACQQTHQRCSEPTCLRLCGGSHPAVLRDGLCMMPGQACCWSRVYNAGRPTSWWLITCVLCARTAVRETPAPPGLCCAHCGSRLLAAETIVRWEPPRELLGTPGELLPEVHRR